MPIETKHNSQQTVPIMHQPVLSKRETPVCVVGVIADTHIPDRVRTLHPWVLPMLRAAGVNHILHAGDISAGHVLDTLREIAPVTAVRGNRDFLAGKLALQEHLCLGGVDIALMHGHHGLFTYLWDKWKFWRFGYRLERYLDQLHDQSRQAKVVVYGHTHYPEIILDDGKMLFNPGSASFGPKKGLKPSMGFLKIYASGRIEAKIQLLEGYRIQNREWLRNE